MSDSSDIPATTEAIQRANDKRRGVSSTEYAVMLVMVAIAMLVFGPAISSAVTGVFSSIASALS